MPGGWTYQSYLTPYDSFIFYNAIGQHENYFYNPVAVAKQIVNGTNYRFITIFINRLMARLTLQKLIFFELLGSAGILSRRFCQSYLLNIVLIPDCSIPP